MQVRPRLSEHRSAASLYIAMAHAGLATALLVLYGLYLLLADFLCPLQWALLCSVPLRETQRVLVAFWEPLLRGGLSAALLALSLAALRSDRHARRRAKKAHERTDTARENFWKLSPYFGKWQVRFAKLLEMSYFSPSHLFSRVGKLQQIVKKKLSNPP